MNKKENISDVKTGRLSHIDFIKQTGEFENYKSWCESHGVSMDEKSAEFYFDQTVSDYDPEDVLMEM